MQEKTSKAFSPGGISSFFEICDRTHDGKAITDLERVGARGGGFGIQKGVRTEVTVSEAKASNICVFINGRPAPEAETTTTVAKMMLDKVRTAYNIVIKHAVQIPIGAGFGTSAGGALTAGLALSQAMDLRLTYNQIGKIAHVAEIKCKTGLGTVGPLMLGGCILTVEPGAPGIAIIDRIPLSPDHVIVAGVFDFLPTKNVLSSPSKRAVVNRWGRKALESILAEPSAENFLACCLEFADKTGFRTDRVRRLVKLAERAGAIGAAQNMLGEVVHALTLEKDAENLVEVFKQVLPNERIIVSKIDSQGARLMGNEDI